MTAPADPGCTPLNPAACVGEVLGAAAEGAIDRFIESVAQAVEDILKTLSTVWMSIPSPDAEGSAVTVLSQNLEWYTVFFAVVGLLIALGRTAVEMRAQPALLGVKMLFTLIVVTACGGAVVATLIRAGDEFAPWIIERATGEGFSTGAATILTASTMTGAGQAIGLIIGILALLGSLAQIVFMIVRAGMLTLLMALLPTFAAASATEGGQATFRKALAWLFAFILFKPVAAVVYAGGFLLLQGDNTGGGGDDGVESIMSVVLGLTVIVLAALTLPALIKFLVPVAAAGASSAFSGAAAAGAVATGAAIVALGAATGGAGAAAGAGAGAGTGTGAATTAGTGAATTGGGTAGTGGGVTGGGGPSGASGSPPPGGGGSSPSGGDLVPGGGSSGGGATGDGPAGAGSVPAGADTTSSGSSDGGSDSGSSPVGSPAPSSGTGTGSPAAGGAPVVSDQGADTTTSTSAGSGAAVPSDGAGPARTGAQGAEATTSASRAQASSTAGGPSSSAQAPSSASGASDSARGDRQAPDSPGARSQDTTGAKAPAPRRSPPWAQVAQSAAGSGTSDDGIEGHDEAGPSGAPTQK